MNQYTVNSLENQTMDIEQMLNQFISDTAARRNELINDAENRVPVTDVLTGEILDSWDTTIYVGADVHSKSYSLCAFNTGNCLTFMPVTCDSKAPNILNYCQTIAQAYKGKKVRFIVGYEAGCLGYSLALQLNNMGINCVIIAPTSIQLSAQDKVSKTDRRDAENLARTLFHHSYQPVWIPDEIDQQVKNYIRLYEDINSEQKKLKQRINAFVLSLGNQYQETKTKWTQTHVNWLKKLELDGINQEVLKEYLNEYDHHEEVLERLEKRIEELSKIDRYEETARNLAALKGVKAHSALLLLSEIGDFNRFENPQTLAKWVGIVPSEHSSGEKSGNRGAITKQGNGHVRKAVIECVQGTVRGKPGYKSKELKKRQKDVDPAVVAYADKAVARIKDKFTRLIEAGKPRNVAITACARELLCFLWGIATGNIHGRSMQGNAGKAAAAA